jgi:pimeloyl-ACP methyl ester carboxylesterase
VCGEAYLSALDTTLPLNVWDQIEESADVTFQIDFPALGDWAFRMSQVDSLPGPRPTMPVLAMLGLDSDSVMPGFRETQQFLMRWLPQAERCGVAGVTHGLQVMNPVAVAEGISAFLGRHPINP